MVKLREIISLPNESTSIHFILHNIQLLVLSYEVCACLLNVLVFLCLSPFQNYSLFLLSAVISCCLWMSAWSNFGFYFVFLSTPSLTLQMCCEQGIYLVSIVIQIVLEQCEENGLILCSFWLKPGVFFPKINYMGVSGLFREFFFFLCIIATFWVVENPLKAECWMYLW